MASPRSTGSFTRCASTLALAALSAVAVVGLRDRRADACGWSPPTVEDVTMFDPAVAGDPAWNGLTFDPFVAGFPGACDDCARKAMLADWRGYLKGAVTDADWEQVLFQASAADLAALAARLAGKATATPPAFAASSLWKATARRKPLQDALALVGLARQVEPVATLAGPDGAAPADPDAAAPATTTAPPARLLTEARAGLKAARDPFLKQRYAFQVLRILFYQRDWLGTAVFFDRNGAALGAPSSDLAWRARYYVAGALRRGGNVARANLELARIHVHAPALAGDAAQDFKPVEDADWRESLRLAKDVREKTELWRLVGMKQDGLVAAQEIVKLDPTSKLVALLIVRELNRAESEGAGNGWGPPDPAAIAAHNKAFAALEPIAVKLATTPGADRPWLMQLVAGHLAAKRGDVAAARTQLEAAVRARPGDPLVASQAKASLALALVLDWKLNPQREDELARAMNGIDPSFGRLATVTGEVRGRLAAAYAQAGRIVDAEFLRPGSADPINESTGLPLDPKAKRRWADVAFIKEMIARTDHGTTEFDKLVLASSYTRAALEKELALRYLVDGDLAAAARTFATTKAESAPLGTDPFVTHIVDCHDCDHQRYANARWTHASFAAQLADLQKRASGKGEPAAQAALALGTALYNVTWYGNARVVLAGTHQETFDTHAAERWYKRAFDLSASRELKAKAAFYAAKAELAALLDAKYKPYDDPAPGLPVPTTWYPVVRRFADTRYYREILRECGAYRGWATK